MCQVRSEMGKMLWLSLSVVIFGHYWRLFNALFTQNKGVLERSNCKGCLEMFMLMYERACCGDVRSERLPIMMGVALILRCTCNVCSACHSNKPFCKLDNATRCQWTNRRDVPASLQEAEILAFRRSVFKASRFMNTLLKLTQEVQRIFR